MWLYANKLSYYIHLPNSHPIYSLSKSLPCLLHILLKFLLTFFVNRTFKKKNVFKTILKETVRFKTYLRSALLINSPCSSTQKNGKSPFTSSYQIQKLFRCLTALFTDPSILKLRYKLISNWFQVFLFVEQTCNINNACNIFV